MSKKLKFVNTAVILILLTSTSMLVINAGEAENRSVYGYVYIDDILAPAGIEVKLTFPINIYTDLTNSFGAYTIDIHEENYEVGTFEVYYNGLWYIPTDNQTIELGGSGETGYNIDLHINTSTIPPDTETPSKVTKLTVYDLKDGILQLSWYPATDNVAVDYYIIFRDHFFIAVTTGTTYFDTGLNNGQRYRYEVQAVDTSNNTGPMSDPAYGTPTASGSGGGGGVGLPGGGESLPNVSFFSNSNVKMIVNSNMSIDLFLFLRYNLSGYNATISISDPSIAEIKSVNFPHWAMLNYSSTLPSDSVLLKALDLGDLINRHYQYVTLASLKLEGKSIGNSFLNITFTKLDDDYGYPIEVIVYNSTLNVVDIPPLPGHQNRPSDTDSDGKLEDVNGNGFLDFDDVVQFFYYFEWIEDNYAIDFFDFNNNFFLDFDDIVKLFWEV